MTRELLNKTIKAIEYKLQKSETYRSPQFAKWWSYKTAEFTFGNGRKAIIRKHIPNDKNNRTGVHYTIEHLCKHEGKHYTLEQIAEKLYQLGLENVDPFKDGVNTKKLKDLGFEQIEALQEPNIKDIGYYLETGFYQYKLEMDEVSTYYGQSYGTGDTPYYYGSTYQDVLKKEFLYVRHGDEGNWTKALFRFVKIGSKCVSNYVGD